MVANICQCLLGAFLEKKNLQAGSTEMTGEGARLQVVVLVQ